MRFSPLRFLRGDLKDSRRKRAVRLPDVSFIRRFRMRIFLQNLSGYLMLLIGIGFVMIMLAMAVGMPDTLSYYQAHADDMMLAEHQVILESDHDEDGNPVTTSNPDAEKFSAYSLKTIGEGGTRVEDVTLYGIQENSRYIDAEFNDKTVLISSAYADKYGYGKDSVITLKEPYEDKYYGFKVTGTYDYDGGIAVFMSKKHLNDVMGLDEESFSGFFSDSEITDIDSKYIGTVINEESLTRVSRQLMISMGSLMYMVDGFSVIMFIVLIYLLSKLIIERNVQSISMAKILGYSKREIAMLYIVPTALVVIASLLISYPILSYVMVWIFRVMLKQMMSGWMVTWLDPSAYVKMFLLGAVTYAVVAVIEYVRIGRIPMSEALKNVE